MAKSPALALHTSVFLIFFGLGIAGCGGNMNNPRQLQSIMVTPASADAQTFPGGKVQFMATGTFNMAPNTVSSMAVQWSISSPSGSAATVDANGLAQCNGFTGSAIVQAVAPTEPEIPLLQMNSMTPSVSGTAQLICP